LITCNTVRVLAIAQPREPVRNFSVPWRLLRPVDLLYIFDRIESEINSYRELGWVQAELFRPILRNLVLFRFHHWFRLLRRLTSSAVKAILLLAKCTQLLSPRILIGIQIQLQWWHYIGLFKAVPYMIDRIYLNVLRILGMFVIWLVITIVNSGESLQTLRVTAHLFLEETVVP